MKVPTSRFGTLDIPEDRVISVPLGLIGFPSQKRYFLQEHRKRSPFIWFQSVDDENLAFVLVDPLLCMPDYEIQVNAEDRKILELPDSCEGLQAMVTVNIAPGDPIKITANLLGPVVINLKKKIAKQIVLHHSSYSTRHPIPTTNA